MASSLCYKLLYLALIYKTWSEEIISATSGYTEIIPRCNSTCRYVEWAFDANCRQRNLEAVPQQCWEAKMLDLRDNRIVTIPANAFQSFRNLLYLDLEENGITDIDTSAFIGNDRVRHIYLQSNHLERIYRGTFAGVPNLLQLYLNSNRISTVEKGAFTGLKRLETLFLSENRLDEISQGLLKGLDRLRYFHMTHNRLTTIHNNTFKDLANLRHLNLINNNIHTIEAGAFKGLLTLRILRLAYNEISIIGYRAFMPVKHLTQLDLYSNKIQIISNFSTSIRNIQDLYLGDNPLICDCHLEPLRLWYREHTVMDSKGNATCNTPENVRGKIIAYMGALICLPTTESPMKEGMKENPKSSARQAPNTAEIDPNHSYLQSQYDAVQTGTILVIVIACLVLFAVCFVGCVCFIYNAYIRTPNYKYVSKEDKKSYKSPDLKVKLTVNPLDKDEMENSENSRYAAPPV